MSPRFPQVSAIVVALVVLIGLNVVALRVEPWFLRVVRDEVVPTPGQIVVYEDAKRADVVFMGSSLVLYGLDPAVAQDEDLDGQAVVGDRLELLEVHLEAAVARQADDRLAPRGEARADGRGEEGAQNEQETNGRAECGGHPGSFRMPSFTVLGLPEQTAAIGQHVGLDAAHFAIACFG